MNWSRLLLPVLIISAVAAQASPETTTNATPTFYKWAETPPMGWNSWVAYGCSVTEDQTKVSADYMAKHLKPFGWEYVIVDIQWYEPKSWGYRVSPER